LGLVVGTGSGAVAVLRVDGWLRLGRYTTAAESNIDLVFVRVIGAHFDDLLGDEAKFGRTRLSSNSGVVVKYFS
jgi:hypothetical protein